MPGLLVELAACKGYLIYALSVVIDEKKKNGPLWRVAGLNCVFEVRAYQGTKA